MAVERKTNQQTRPTVAICRAVSSVISLASLCLDLRITVAYPIGQFTRVLQCGDFNTRERTILLRKSEGSEGLRGSMYRSGKVSHSAVKLPPRMIRRWNGGHPHPGTMLPCSLGDPYPPDLAISHYTRSMMILEAGMTLPLGQKRAFRRPWRSSCSEEEAEKAAERLPEFQVAHQVGLRKDRTRLELRNPSVINKLVGVDSISLSKQRGASNSTRACNLVGIKKKPRTEVRGNSMAGQTIRTSNSASHC